MTIGAHYMQQPVDERYKLSLLYPAVNGCTEVSSCCICSIAHCKGMACACFPQLPAPRQSKTQLNSQNFNCPFYISSTSAALDICMVQDIGGQSIGPNCTGTYRLQGVRCLLDWLWGLTSLHPQARSLFAPLSLCDGRTPPVRQMWAWGVPHCKDIAAMGRKVFETTLLPAAFTNLSWQMHHAQIGIPIAAAAALQTNLQVCAGCCKPQPQLVITAMQMPSTVFSTRYEILVFGAPWWDMHGTTNLCAHDFSQPCARLQGTDC